MPKGTGRPYNRKEKPASGREKLRRNLYKGALERGGDPAQLEAALFKTAGHLRDERILLENKTKARMRELFGNTGRENLKQSGTTRERLRNK